MLIAWISEIMVGAIEPTAHELGFSNLFVGVFIVLILGNAVEHSTAALKNRTDLRDQLRSAKCAGCSLRGTRPGVGQPFPRSSAVHLGPSGGLILMVLPSVLITGQAAGDGRSDWPKSVQLIPIYLVFGLTFYFPPSVHAP